MTKLELLKELTAIIEAYNEIDIYDSESIVRDLIILRNKIYEEVK